VSKKAPTKKDARRKQSAAHKKQKAARQSKRLANNAVALDIKKSNLPLFAQVLALVPKIFFGKLVDKFHADKFTKKFTSWSHLVSMLLAQFCGLVSIRDLIGLIATAPQGIKDLFNSSFPSRSSLSNANKNRSYLLFREMFKSVLQMTFDRLKQQRAPTRYLKNNLIVFWTQL
jgi:hypothetical protein